jgi:hypothetical protein
MRSTKRRAARGGGVGFDQQGGALQGDLALPQGGEGVELGEIKGDVVGGQGMQAEAQAGGEPGGHVALAGQVGPVEDDHGPGASPWSSAAMCSASACWLAAISGGGADRAAGAQAGVELVDAGEVVQHPFVDLQAGGEQGAVAHGVEQAPAAQRGGA